MDNYTMSTPFKSSNLDTAFQIVVKEHDPAATETKEVDAVLKNSAVTGKRKHLILDGVQLETSKLGEDYIVLLEGEQTISVAGVELIQEDVTIMNVIKQDPQQYDAIDGVMLVILYWSVTQDSTADVKARTIIYRINK
ncbi:MAG: hypothetical protein EZS28_013311 [Streblomastix strix]|uniref:Uncharacterized protein n=1 Tax=Streblomastix strix TaxID=222440 RepID=A0A5J4W9H5_9EUKA|nr:MAG: hypothetical protein EZS28_013311 [Streblomastix strix]